MKDGSPILRRSIGAILEVLDQDKFESLTIRKLLFGYANPLIKLGRDVLPPDKRWPHELFGLFVGVSFKLGLFEEGCPYLTYYPIIFEVLA